MSVSRPFLGKLRVLDTMSNGVITLKGQQGSGSRLICYQTGMVDSLTAEALVQLQTDGVTPRNPAALPYLLPAGTCGSSYFINPGGYALLPSEAIPFYYREGNPPALWGSDKQPGTWGFWLVNGVSHCWAWANTNTLPPTINYTIQIIASSAWHARRSGNRCPPNGDYTGCDLSGEDWTHLTVPSALFDGADLSGVDFGFADLTGSDFRKALSIKGTKFVNCNLSQARFAGLNLSGYDFSGASLDGADFTGADLTGAIFADSADRPASLLKTDLSVAKSVKGARFRCELNQTRFDGMDLSGIDFTGSRLTGTSLRRTNLRVAVLDSPPLWSQDRSAPTDLASATIHYAQTCDAAKHGDWSGTNLTGTSMPDLPTDLSSLKAINAVLPKWDFFKVNLQSANLSGADLRNCNFSYANLTFAVLKGAQCQGGDGYRAAVFEGAMMQNADLSGANLSGASMSGVYLYGGQAKLTQATLVQTSFAAAYLPAMLFTDDSGVACQGADFTGACLVNAKFNGTDLSAYGGQPVGFYHACLQGADFTGARLQGAAMTGSAVATASGTIPVKVLIWPNQYVWINLTYSHPTLGVDDPTVTDDDTICPDGEAGPCQGKKLIAPDAPTSWPVGEIPP